MQYCTHIMALSTCGCRRVTEVLVRVVTAVVIPIAGKTAADAAAGFAREVRCQASACCAALLVGSITTIDNLVANPGRVDTVTTR